MSRIMFYVYILGSFRWISKNEEPSFNGWPGESPDNAHGLHNCVHHHRSGWNNMPCSSTKARALCQYSRGKENN